MAWEHFPVARGQRITAAMLNELRDACVERGLTTGLAPAVSRGDSMRTIPQFLAGLRLAISTGVSAFRWLESYTDADNFSYWVYTINATNSTPNLFGMRYKNIFEHAIGDDYDTWRHQDSSPLLAEELNDFHAVLNKLTHKGVGFSGGDFGSGDGKAGLMASTPAAALSNCDSAGWAPNYGMAPWLHLLQMSKSGIDPNYSYQAGMSRAHNGNEVSLATNMAKVYVVLTASGEASRSLTGYVRQGTGSWPTTWTQASSWGSPLATFSGNPSTRQHKVFAFTSTTRLVYVGGAITASGSGLDASSKWSESYGIQSDDQFAEMQYEHAA